MILPESVEPDAADGPKSEAWVTTSDLPEDPQLGPVLSKALFDPFDYAIGLRSGAVIRFQSAERRGDWLLLENPFRTFESDFRDALPHACPRGVQVRIDEIVWAADAPEGS